jgi:hypothetical protein
MDWWTLAGTGSLGLVIGWLVWTFVGRVADLNLKALTALVTIVGGGVALGVWRFSQDQGLPREANAYFIGIFMSVLILGLLYGPPPEDKPP